MADWQTMDLMSNPEFMPQDSGDGGISLGTGNGSSWFDWGSNPAFSQEQLNSFYTPGTGMYGSGEGGRGWGGSIDVQALNDMLKQNNYSLRTQSGGTGSRTEYRGLFDNDTNQQLGNTFTAVDTPTTLGFVVPSLAQMFLNPLSGGVTGLGGPMNLAMSSGINAFGHGGDLGDVAKAAALSGGLDMLPNVSGTLNTGNSTFNNMLDSGVKSAVEAGIQGGNPLQSGLMSAVVQGLNGLGGPPDVGTLGGTMADAEGETSATLGGETTPAQAGANMQVSSVGNSSPMGGSDLMSNISNLLGFGSGKTGDMLQGLASLYLYNKQRRMAKDFMNQIAGNRSAYGQQMQQALARRDAASGRRSDYGGREVELQAKLAALDSQNAPAVAQLQQMQTGGLLGMLNSGLVTGQRMGWWGNNTPATPTIPTGGYGSTLPSLSQLGGSSPYSLMEDTNKKKYSLLGGN